MSRSRISRTIALVLAAMAAGEAPAQFPGARGAGLPRGGQGCAFEVVAAVDFGAYDDGSPTSVLSTATFRVRCSGVAGPLTLASGPSSVTGDFVDRRLRGPGNSDLRYQLYTSSSRTAIWGDGTRGTSVISVAQSGGPLDVTIHAELLGSQSGEVGDYRDTIVVTVLP